jgi:hypothetical protein
MKDKTVPVVVLHTLSIVLFVVVLGMLGAKLFGGVDISTPIIMSQMTVAISLQLVARAAAAKGDKTPD